jgi:phenylalanyl-tRNA synthetase beta chain
MMDLALFEVGHAFHGGEPTEQHLQAVGLLVGQSGPRDPHGARRPVDVFDVKADAEAVLSAMGAPAKAQILRGAAGLVAPRSPRDGLPRAQEGAGHLRGTAPPVLAAMDVKGPAMAFTLFPAEIPTPKDTSASRGAVTLPEFQSVDRDFAFVVDAEVEAAALANAAQGADKSLIADVRVFDEFIGGSLGEGKKSIALTVHLQPTDRTLTEDEIDAVAAKVVEKVTKATGGVLRG